MGVSPAVWSAAADGSTPSPGSCWTAHTCARPAGGTGQPGHRGHGRRRAGGGGRLRLPARPARRTCGAAVDLARPGAHRPGGVRARGAAGGRAGRRLPGGGHSLLRPDPGSGGDRELQGLRQAADGGARACPPPRYGSFDRLAAAEAFIDAQRGRRRGQGRRAVRGQGRGGDLVPRRGPGGGARDAGRSQVRRRRRPGGHRGAAASAPKCR